MPGLTLFGCKKKYIIFTKIKNIRRTHIPGLVTHGRNKVKRFQIKL